MNDLQTELHYHTPYQLERLSNKIREHPEILESNKNHIFRYFALCKAQRISNARLAKTLWIMRNLAVWFGQKDFQHATKDDIIDLVNIVNAKYPNELTSLDYRSVLKKFYREIFGNNDRAPESVAWIKVGRGNRRVNPAFLLGESDILRLLHGQDGQNEQWARIRNKALIAFLYEAGVRVGELLSMKIQDIQFGKELWFITVRGKTGQRTFPVCTSIPYLKDYLEIHPRRSIGESYFWCRYLNPDRRITYEQVTKTLRRAARRAAVTKPVNPHNFRKTACSRDCAYMSDQQLKRKYGWTPDSKELRTYAHVRLEDLENAVRSHYGLTENRQAPEFTVKLCPSCHSQNKAHQQFCAGCSRPLVTADFVRDEKDHALELIREVLAVIADAKPELKNRLQELIANRDDEARAAGLSVPYSSYAPDTP